MSYSFVRMPLPGLSPGVRIRSTCSDIDRGASMTLYDEVRVQPSLPRRHVHSTAYSSLLIVEKSTCKSNQYVKLLMRQAVGPQQCITAYSFKCTTNPDMHQYLLVGSHLNKITHRVNKKQLSSDGWANFLTKISKRFCGQSHKSRFSWKSQQGDICIQPCVITRGYSIDEKSLEMNI